MAVSAKFAVIKIGGVTLSGSTGYTLEIQADDLDATTGSSGGVVQTEPGCIKGTLRGTITFDKTASPFSALTPGTAITNAAAYDDLNGPARVSVTAGYIMSMNKRAETRSKIELDFTIACNTFAIA